MIETLTERRPPCPARPLAVRGYRHVSQVELPISPPPPTAVRSRHGWEFCLTEREVMLLRKPITETSGGWQGAMREAATRFYPGNTWRVSDVLIRRLYRMCCKQGELYT